MTLSLTHITQGAPQQNRPVMEIPSDLHSFYPRVGTPIPDTNNQRCLTCPAQGAFMLVTGCRLRLRGHVRNREPRLQNNTEWAASLMTGYQETASISRFPFNSNVFLLFKHENEEAFGSSVKCHSRICLSVSLTCILVKDCSGWE